MDRRTPARSHAVWGTSQPQARAAPPSPSVSAMGVRKELVESNEAFEAESTWVSIGFDEAPRLRKIPNAATMW